MSVESIINDFLSRYDTSGWEKCLKTVEASLNKVDQQDSQWVEYASAAIRISSYLQWFLYHEDQDHKRQEINNKQKQYFQGLLKNSHSDSDFGRIGQAAFWAYNNYHKKAQSILNTINQGSIGRFDDISLLLVMPDPPTVRAVKLQSNALVKPPFLPTLFFYCHALFYLGRFKDITLALDSHPMLVNSNHPLLIELRGQIANASSDWCAAYNFYSKSSWPSHKYQALLCNILCGKKQENGQQMDHLRKIVKEHSNAVQMMEAEIKEFEQIRTANFFSAIRQVTFSDWFIDFELAKQQFRQRRHLEAFKSFYRAINRYGIADCPSIIIRDHFSNLTWLTNSSVYRRVDLTPEAIEAGFLAIQQNVPWADGIRTWIASSTQQNELLSIVMQGDNLCEKAGASAQLGDEADALSLFWESLQYQYIPRSIHYFIQQFGQALFVNSICTIVDVVLEESQESFFEQWEIINILFQEEFVEIAREYDSGNSFLKRCNMVIENVRQLCGSEFQNLIRAVEFFDTLRLHDLTGELLLQAANFAEVPEEHIQVAVAWRECGFSDRSNPNDIGIKALFRAARESQDIGLRIEVAKEFCNYKCFTQARTILISEQLIKTDAMINQLLPHEYISLLECHICFEKAELIQTTISAIKSLKESIDCGIINNASNFFITRLKETIVSTKSSEDESVLSLINNLCQEHGLPPIEKEAKSEGNESEEIVHNELQISNNKDLENKSNETENRPIVSESQYLQDTFEKTVTEELTHIQLREHLQQKLRPCVLQIGFFGLICYWCDLRTAIENERTKAINAKPKLSKDSTPILFDTTGETGKVEKLATLWRQYLGVLPAPDGIDQELKTFLQEEEKLRAQWNLHQIEAGKQNLLRALVLIEEGLFILDAIGDSVIDDPIHALNHIKDSIRKDVERVKKYFQDIAEEIKKICSSEDN